MAVDGMLDGVRIEIAEDRLSATLVIEPGVRTEELNVFAIDTLLATRGISSTTVHRAHVEAAIRDFKCRSDNEVRAVIARGLPPRHPVDPAIVTMFPEPTLAPPTDSSGRIDQHARSRIPVVRAGAIIARITPPSEGSDGFDVLGHNLAAKQPKPLAVTFDESVSPKPDGTVVAVVGGIPDFDGRTLKVSHRLGVPGSVDFSTGNIEFPGDVEIERGVRDQFTVAAGRDLFVHDLIEAATISAQRDATIDRGMAAREMGTLSVGRDLRIRYITDCAVTVGRDAVVEGDVVNCRLVVGRSYRSPAGKLIRGTLTVANQCEVGAIGSETNPPTTIILGRLPTVIDRVRVLAQALPNLAAKVAAAEQKLKALRSARRPTATQAEEMTELEFSLQRDREVQTRAVNSVHRMENLTSKHTSFDLTVHDTLFPGVTIFIGAWRAEITRIVRGPLRITLDESKEPILVSLTTKTTSYLNTVARVIRDPDCIDISVLARSAGIPPPPPRLAA